MINKTMISVSFFHHGPIELSKYFDLIKIKRKQNIGLNLERLQSIKSGNKVSECFKDKNNVDLKFSL